MVRLLVLVPALVLLMAGSNAVDAADAFDTAIQANMNALGLRGLSVVFFDKNLNANPIIRSYGKIDADDASLDVTTDTAFSLASVTKHFIGAAVATLINSGTISSLDDFICDKVFGGVTNSACQHPSFLNNQGKITWRDLVTHRAALDSDINLVTDKDGKNRYASYGPTGKYKNGLAAGGPTCPLTDIVNFYEVYMVSGTSKTTTVASDLQIDNAGTKVNWYNAGNPAWTAGPPGDVQLYSNFAYGYIPALIQRLLNKDFMVYAKEALFDKLGMTRTGFSREALAAAGVRVAVPCSAANYAATKTWTSDGHYCFIDYGSGQLYTTANDMNLWLQSMVKKGADKLWSAATGELFTTCQEKDENDVAIDSATCKFGMGVIVLNNNLKNDAAIVSSSDLGAFTKYDWTGAFWHDGNEVGVTSQFYVFPASNVYAFAVTNVDGGPVDLAPVFDSMVSKASQAVVPNPAPAPAPAPGGCFTNMLNFFQTTFGLRGGGGN